MPAKRGRSAELELFLESLEQRLLRLEVASIRRNVTMAGARNGRAAPMVLFAPGGPGFSASPENESAGECLRGKEPRPTDRILDQLARRRFRGGRSIMTAPVVAITSSAILRDFGSRHSTDGPSDESSRRSSGNQSPRTGTDSASGKGTALSRRARNQDEVGEERDGEDAKFFSVCHGFDSLKWKPKGAPPDHQWGKTPPACGPLDLPRRTGCCARARTARKNPHPGGNFSPQGSGLRTCELFRGREARSQISASGAPCARCGRTNPCSRRCCCNNARSLRHRESAPR